MFPAEVARQYYEAQRLYVDGKAAQALAILDVIERQSPNHPEVMHARALCLHAAGQEREALKVCNLLYTMHRDRRGLELRKRWMNPRWVAETAVRPAEEEAPPASPGREAPRPFEPIEVPAVRAVNAAGRHAVPALDERLVQHAAVIVLGLSAQLRPLQLDDDSKVPPRLCLAGCTAAEYNAGITQHHDVCLPQAVRVVEAARRASRPVIFLPWGFSCHDGSDLSPHVFTRMREDFGPDPQQWPTRKGGDESTIAPLFSQSEGDYVLFRTGDDAFTSTNLRFVLQNLGVRSLIYVGGPAETALSRTVSTGKRRSFVQVIAHDATIATQELSREAILADAGAEYLAPAERLCALFEAIAAA